LDRESEEDRSTMNMDHGRLSKKKYPPIDSLDHLAIKKETQAGEALKTWVKFT
jgi:hypothetical protein